MWPSKMMEKTTMSDGMTDANRGTFFRGVPMKCERCGGVHTMSEVRVREIGAEAAMRELCDDARTMKERQKPRTG